MKKFLLLVCCSVFFTQCIIPENEDDAFDTDDIIAVDDGMSGTDDGMSGTDDGTGNEDPYYGFINFPLTGISPITEPPQCGQLQVLGRDTEGPPYIAVRAFGINQGGVSFTPDYYTVFGTNTNFADHPYMFVDYRTTNTGQGDLFYVSVDGNGFWSSPETYVIVANVRELRRNGAPNFDYFLTGPTFTVSSEFQFDYDDVVNACFN